MSRTLQSKVTRNEEATSTSTGQGMRSSSGRTIGSDTGTSSGTERSSKTGTGTQYANIACLIQFSIPILGRFPTGGESTSC